MTTKKLLLAGVLSFSILTLGGSRAWATDNPLCKPDQTIFQKIGNAFKALDIRKTVQNMIVTALTDGPIQLIAARNPSEMVECSYSAFKNSGNTGLEARADSMTGSGGACPSLNTSADCSDFTQTYDYVLNTKGGMLSYIDNRATGSLLGIANTLEGGIKTEPVPVNLALFWNDSVKNVPFAGSALAANVNYGSLPTMIMDPLLQVWKIFRNIAFGILSIVMLVVGVMIMTRKKLSPQLVVTAQYALPRIALAVILIIFSYPIGAVLASSMNYLAKVIEGLIFGSLNYTQGATTGLLIAILFVDLLASGLALGIPGLVVVAVLALVTLILKIFIIIRAWLLLLKLIFSIVFSPVQFAIGAIPGNESSMQNWFKKAVGYVAGYVALFAMAAVVDAIVLIVAGATTPVSSATFPGVATGILTVIFTPVILIFGYIQALKIPNKVEGFISGDPKKPGGRR